MIMKTVLLVLLFAGTVVLSKGLREDDGAEDDRLEMKAEKRYGRFPLPYKYSVGHIKEVRKALDSFCGSAAQRARRLLQKVDTDWNKQPKSERLLRNRAVEGVASNIRAIANARNDTTAAILAVLDLFNLLKYHMAPYKDIRIDNMPAMFVTSCMNLLGETVDSFPLQSIISEEMRKVQKKYKEISKLHKQVKASYFSYLDLKNILNKLGKDEDRIRLRTKDVERMNLYRSAFDDGFPGILRGHIQKLISGNNYADAKTYFAHLDLYIKLDIVMQMMLTHALSIIPRHNRSLSNSFQTQIEKQKEHSQQILKAVQIPPGQSKFLAYMDWGEHMVTGKYEGTMYDYRYTGFSDELICIALIGENIPWKWSQLPGKKHPYFHKGDKNTPCKWKMVPHGKYLYSLVNKYDCPKGPWCDAMLSFDDGNAITLEHDNPVLWEMTTRPMGGQPRGYRIRPKQFCGKKCSISYDRHTLDGYLDCHPNQLKVPQRWTTFKGSYRDLDSTSTNQTSVESQEDNSASGREENDGVSNFSDENENEILEKSKQETNESESNQDSNENNIKD